MTAIVGVEHNGRVYMGADSAVTCGNSLSLTSEPKVFVRGEFAMAWSGNVRYGQLLRHALKVPRLPANSDVGRYLVTTFSTALRKAFKPDMRIDAGNEAGTHPVVWALIGVRGKLYTLGHDTAIVATGDGYAAEGSGCEVALGYLRATRGDMPKRRILGALEAAAYHTTYVRAPFTVVSV